MAIPKEYPRGGLSNGIIENRGEMHLPCVILLDTSSSMKSSLEQLNEGLKNMIDSIKEDSYAVGKVEFCIISFDDYARVVAPFCSVYDYESPILDCAGTTAMHEAVDLALSEIEIRKEQYKNEKTPYYRPWIFMLTDGGANDEDNGAFERLIEAQKSKHCIFFPVAIGDEVDKNLLKSLKIDGVILKADKENFKGAFLWLSNSLTKTSNSNPGQKVILPKPTEYQIEIEA